MEDIPRAADVARGRIEREVLNPMREWMKIYKDIMVRLWVVCEWWGGRGAAQTLCTPLVRPAPQRAPPTTSWAGPRGHVATGQRAKSVEWAQRRQRRARPAARPRV